MKYQGRLYKMQALPQNAMECGKTGDWLRDSVKQHSVPMRDLPRCATSLHSAAHVRKSFGHAVRSFVHQEHAGVKAILCKINAS
jgi:hypothetical protein